MIYTDAHCHIFSSETPRELGGRVSCCTQTSDWDRAIAYGNDKNIPAIGIHPWYVSDTAPGWAVRMHDLLLANPNIMVGEIGLDKYHDNMPEQIRIFTTQLELSAALHRPVLLHCVGAWDKILQIFKAHKSSMPPAIIAHAFNGDATQIERMAIEYNMYFSFGAPRSDAKSKLRIAATPLTHLLCESDTFDQFDEVQKIINAITAIAEILGLPTTEIAKITTTNFLRILKLCQTD